MLTIYKFHEAFAGISSICLLCWGHVALWLCRLLMNKVVGLSILILIPNHTPLLPLCTSAHPSNWGYLSLYLAWVLCFFVLLTFGFQCSSSPAPGRQHLFNFLCGAIRAKHPPQLLPSSNLKWKVVCHINTHMRYARPLAERKHKNDMFRPYLWAVNSHTTTTTTRWRNVSSDIWSTHADNPVEQRRRLSTAFSEGFPA